MKTKQCLYLVGSMEFRTYEELKYEHFYIRQQLSALGIEKVIDPLIKEKHKPGKKVTLTKCGVKPRKVYEIDMGAVEESNIIFWITGDVVSEGSITEVAAAGMWNRWNKKPKKHIVIVSPLRHSQKKIHFSNFHKGVKIVNTVEQGIEYIKRVIK